MINSKELVKKAGITQKLRLGEKTDKGVVGTGPKRVKLIEDKIIKAMDPQNGKETEYVRYIVEENGEKKQYDTKLRNKDGGLSYLVQKLSEFKEGSEVILEMKKRGIKNYVSVTQVIETGEGEVDEEHEDLGEIIE